MGISNTFLTCLLVALASGFQARARDLESLGPGEALMMGDRLVSRNNHRIVADLEPDQAMLGNVGGPRLTVHNLKVVRAATPPIVDIALPGETFGLLMSPEGGLFLVSLLDGRPNQEIWRNTFEDGRWAIPGSRLELGDDGGLRILAPDGRTTWQAFHP